MNNKFYHQVYENHQKNYISNQNSNKSPFKRNQLHQNNQSNNIQRSPIRSRTPQKGNQNKQYKNAFPNNIKYITNVTPVKQKNVQPLQQSNGQNVKYVKNESSNKKKQSNLQFSKKTDKNYYEQKGLFGKIVDKMNSQKKKTIKQKQNVQKTSLFKENLQPKQLNNNRGQQRTQRTFNDIKNIIIKKESKVVNIVKEQQICRKNSDGFKEQQNLSCIVYTASNAEAAQKYRQFDLKSDRKHSEIQKNTLQRQIIRKTSSKIIENYQNQQRNEHPVDKDEQQWDFLLDKIKSNCKSNRVVKNDNNFVKISFDVMSSLSMDPFI